MIARLGRWCFVHRRATLLTWIAILIGVGALGNTIVGPDFSSKLEIPASESATGFKVLNESFPGQGSAGRSSGSIVFKADQGVTDRAVQAAMTTMFEQVDAIEGVTVISPYDPSQQVQRISPDGTIAYATVNLDEALGQQGMADAGAQIQQLEPTLDGLTVEVGGQMLAKFKPPESELIGLGFAIPWLINTLSHAYTLPSL